MNARESQAWSEHARRIDEAEYRRAIEHRAFGEQEATARYAKRVADSRQQLAVVVPSVLTPNPNKER